MKNEVRDEEPQVKNRGWVLAALGLVILVAMLFVGIMAGGSDSANDTQAQLKTSYIGPSELVARWDSVIVGPSSRTLVEGRFRNIADYALEFRNVIYKVVDRNGIILWEKQDEMFTDWTEIGFLGEIPFDCHPVFGTDAALFELTIRDVQRVNK